MTARGKKVLIVGAVALVGVLVWRRARAGSSSRSSGSGRTSADLLDPYAEPQDCSGRIGVVDPVSGEVEWREVWQEGCD